MKEFFKKLKARWRPDRLSRAAVTALIIGIVIAVNAVVYALDAAFGLYLYQAQTLDLSLSDAPAEAFSEAMERGDEVTILFCQSEDDVMAHTTGRFVCQTAKAMAEAFPSFIKLEFTNIVVNPERVAAYRNEEEGVYVASTSVIFIHENNHRVLTSVNNTGYVDFYTLNSSNTVVAYNGEEVMTASILWVLEDEHKTAYFTTGHAETASMTLTSLLGCAGYRIGTLDLHTREVPSDAAMLVISNPMQDFERAAAGSQVQAEMDRLQRYMERGGTVVVLLDPYLKNDLTVLKSFMADYGIAVASSVTEDGQRVSHIVRDSDRSVSIDGLSIVCDLADGPVGGRIRDTLQSGGRGNVLLSVTAALTVDASKGAEALLLSSPTATTEAGGKVVDREGSYPLVAYSEQTDGDITSRIVVVPSVYLTAASAMITNGYENRDFLYALFDTLGDGQDMPYHCKTALLATTTLENLTMGTARRLTALIMAIPAALAVVGTVVVVRRKHR